MNYLFNINDFVSIQYIQGNHEESQKFSFSVGPLCGKIDDSATILFCLWPTLAPICGFSVIVYLLHNFFPTTLHRGRNKGNRTHGRVSSNRGIAHGLN